MTWKMMTKTSIKIIKRLLVLNVMAVLVIVFFFKTTYLSSFEIGFFSSALVMGASLLAYRRMVDTRVEHNIITLDDSKDVIDKLEDPYDLYSEEVIEVEKPLVEVVKEERKKVKANSRSLYETLKDTKAALSVYRLAAYAVLILGFLYLNRHGLLHIPSYILALGMPPIVIVILLLKEKEHETEDTLQSTQLHTGNQND
ncbi:MAG: PspA/IM30 family protein [Sulfurovum sp.]|nr:PspA/IM30 family protein [Sulfurovum sp.]